MSIIKLKETKAKDLKLGDLVARSSGTITALEFLPIHEIRTYADGRIFISQKTKNGITLSTESIVYVVQTTKE